MQGNLQSILTRILKPLRLQVDSSFRSGNHYRLVLSRLLKRSIPFAAVARLLCMASQKDIFASHCKGDVECKNAPGLKDRGGADFQLPPFEIRPSLKAASISLDN